MGAGFAAGIGAGIAIGLTSGKRQGQEQVCSYLAKNDIALFDQEGKKVSVDELRQNTKVETFCRINNKVGLQLAIFGLVLLVAIAVAVYFAN